MLKNLPASLLNTVEQLLSTQDILTSCRDCGMVVGSCIHANGVYEDAISVQHIPDEDQDETELSGDKEEVIINPEYKTFIPRRAY